MPNKKRHTSWHNTPVIKIVNVTDSEDKNNDVKAELYIYIKKKRLFLRFDKYEDTYPLPIKIKV